MYYKLLCLFIFISSYYLHAQEIKYTEDIYPGLKYYGLSGMVYHNKYNKISGDAFLYPDWLQGDIIMTDGSKLKDIFMKIDAYSNNLVIYHSVSHQLRGGLEERFRDGGADQGADKGDGAVGAEGPGAADVA